MCNGFPIFTSGVTPTDLRVLALVITSIGGTRTQRVPYLYTNVYGICLVQYFPAYYPRFSIGHTCHSRDQSLATSQQPMQLDKGPVKHRISEHQMHSAHFIIHCCGCNLLAMLQAKQFFKRKCDWIDWWDDIGKDIWDWGTVILCDSVDNCCQCLILLTHYSADYKFPFLWDISLVIWEKWSHLCYNILPCFTFALSERKKNPFCSRIRNTCWSLNALLSWQYV